MSSEIVMYEGDYVRYGWTLLETLFFILIYGNIYKCVYFAVCISVPVAVESGSHLTIILNIHEVSCK
jgi:hypothetical protein